MKRLITKEGREMKKIVRITGAYEDEPKWIRKYRGAEVEVFMPREEGTGVLAQLAVAPDGQSLFVVKTPTDGGAFLSMHNWHH